MASPTGQACKNSPCHEPAVRRPPRVGLGARGGGAAERARDVALAQRLRGTRNRKEEKRRRQKGDAGNVGDL